MAADDGGVDAAAEDPSKRSAPDPCGAVAVGDSANPGADSPALAEVGAGLAGGSSSGDVLSPGGAHMK